ANVSLHHLQICPEKRSGKLHQLSIVQHFSRRTVQIAQRRDKGFKRQIVNGPLSSGQMWSCSPGNKQDRGLHSVLLPHSSGQFEADKSPHTVSKECKWLGKITAHFVGKPVHKAWQLGVGRLLHSGASSRKPDGAHFNKFRQRSLPCTKNILTAAGIGKTK